MEAHKKQLEDAHNMAQDAHAQLNTYKQHAEMMKKDLNAKANVQQPAQQTPSSPRVQPQQVAAQVQAHPQTQPQAQPQAHVQAQPQQAQVQQANVQQPAHQSTKEKVKPLPIDTKQQHAQQNEDDIYDFSSAKPQAQPQAQQHVQSSQTQLQTHSVSESVGGGAGGVAGVGGDGTIDLRSCNEGEFVKQLVKAFVTKHRLKQQQQQQQQRPSSASSLRNALDTFSALLRGTIFKHRKDGSVVTVSDLSHTLTELNILSKPEQCAYLLKCCDSTSVESVMDFMGGKLNAYVVKDAKKTGGGAGGRAVSPAAALVHSESQVCGDMHFFGSMSGGSWQSVSCCDCVSCANTVSLLERFRLFYVNNASRCVSLTFMLYCC